MPWADRVMVEERRWIDRGPTSPRPSACASSCRAEHRQYLGGLGKRWFGWRGSLVGFLGLVARALRLGARRSSRFYADYRRTIPPGAPVVIGVGAAGARLFIGTR